jgi:hypothetical protein
MSLHTVMGRREAEAQGWSVAHDGRSAINDDGDMVVLREAVCFYCGRPLESGYAVNWRGAAPVGPAGVSDITLHPGCVLALTIRLLSDVHQWERGRPRPPAGP